VIPAAEVHPGVQQTRKIEERPTIVSLVTPTWPERVTDLKRKYEEQLKEGSEAFNMKQALLAEREERKKTVLKLADEKDKAESKAENFRKLWVRCQSSLKEVAESLPEDAKEALLELLQESGSRTPSND
jgi:predicted nuclease with TOPRIM domain